LDCSTKLSFYTHSTLYADNLEVNTFGATDEHKSAIAKAGGASARYNIHKENPHI
jgi:hypothetical protein